MSEVITCTDRVAEYLRGLVVDQIRVLLDDPYGATSELQEHVELLHETCTAMGLSFDGIVMSEASEYERVRLYSMLS